MRSSTPHAPPTAGPHPLRLAHGVRACEVALLGRIAAHAEAVRGEPARLAAPLRVVVPSRSLREHLAARIAADVGAVAGVRVQTLYHLAREVLHRAGLPAPGPAGRVLLPVLVRRAAAEEPVLRAVLEHLEDGYGAAVASVSDLLDAGFETSLRAPLLEALRANGDAPEVDRACAVVRVAARVRQALEEEGLDAPADLFVAARRTLEGAPETLPAAAILVHGYADATGVQADLLETLVRHVGAEAWLDLPPDPVQADRPAPGHGFADRLRQRLGAGGEAPAAPAPPPGPTTLLRAPGAHAEVRAVAERLFRLVHREGVVPERIAVVARDPARYRAPVRIHLHRMGIPFSGWRGSLAPEGRRVHALLELLERGDRCTADRWLDASDRLGRLRKADLRLALHGMGLGRLRDVAERLEELVGDEHAYVLPVRRGLEVRAGGEEGEEAAAHAPRRRVGRATLEGAWRSARAVRTGLARLAAAATLGPALAELRRLLRELGWRPETPGAGELYAVLAGLEAELGSGLAIGPGELRILLRRALADVGRPPLGGRGGGVQLLSVTEARARSFEHLFVLGMNRGVFPRPVTDDPLLPDALRRRATDVLADLPIKERGFDEERYLFAQLLTSAEQVVLSWQEVSDDGKERTASPLVERLRLAAGAEAEPVAPVLDARDPDLPRPALEHAIREAHAGGARRLQAPLAAALAAGPAARQAEHAARTRTAAVEELEGVGARRAGLGPWFGFVGPVREKADLRREPLHVTRLEELHHCPWQTFLRRVLGLEPVPDALAALPDVTPLLLGDVVHAVLEQVVARAGAPVGEELERLRGAPAVDVPWPPDDALHAMVREAAVAATRREGIVLPGFARLLAGRALPLVLRAGALEWGAQGVLHGVVGAELRGRIVLPGPEDRPLHFRADRADALGGGRLALVDYKTGKPISTGRRPDTRRGHLLQDLASGRRLQAAVYARAAGEGRYLFAKEGVPDDCARVVLRDDDAEAGGRLDAALDALLGAWETGVFPPRLLDPTLAREGAACAWCELADACLRGDTGSRRRLARWLGEGGSEGAAARGGPEDAAVDDDPVRRARRLADQVGWTR